MKTLLFISALLALPLFAVEITDLFANDSSMCADGGDMANCEPGTTLVFDASMNCNCLSFSYRSMDLPSCPNGSMRTMLTRYENPANDDRAMVFAGYTCVVSILNDNHEPVGTTTSNNTTNTEISLTEFALAFLKVVWFPSLANFDSRTILAVNSVQEFPSAHGTAYVITATQNVNGFFCPVGIRISRSSLETRTGMQNRFEVTIDD